MTQLVLSELTLSAIQAEATRAHLRHGDKSMLGPYYTDPERLAILAEEAGEATEEIKKLSVLIQLGMMSTDMLIAIGRVGHALTYDQDVNEVREKLEKELIQVAAMAATWIEQLNRR